MDGRKTHLEALESKAIEIVRETVILFSAGKDSTAMAQLAIRAFYLSKPPVPLIHVDSTWEFQWLIKFRYDFARDHGFRLIAYAKEEGRAAGINPFEHGHVYIQAMRTGPLKTSLDEGGCGIISGGARRDEEKSRAKARVVSICNPGHVWEPQSQPPEVRNPYNQRLARGQRARVFPLSNCTETDIWTYALTKNIEIAPLYYAAPRPVVERNGAFIVLDEESRMRFRTGDEVSTRKVRFHTPDCWQVMGVIESDAAELTSVVAETSRSRASERQGRVSHREDGGSLEQKKREGYF